MPKERPTVDQILIHLIANLSAAISAYKTYAKRYGEITPTDPFYKTRIKDFETAVERGRKAVKELIKD